ncbi:subtilisin-like protease [Cryomyces antarcticus]
MRFFGVSAALLLTATTAASYGSSPRNNTLSASPSSATAAPSTSTSHQSGGREYVVIFDSAHPEPPHVADVLSRIDLSSNHSDVRYTFNNSAFRGFVANMKSHCITALNNMTDVAVVEESVSIASTSPMKSRVQSSRRATPSTRNSAPWGLQRISTAATVSGDPDTMDFTYSYDSSALGAGADIYVVDSGINTAHAVFGGRASMGFSFEQDSSDGDGHGTHVSGTAAGTTFGVTSGANIIGVKVLGSDGSGSSSATLAGMDWVIQQHDARKTQPGFVGSVMSMSWALQSTSSSVDQAIAAAVQAGLHVSVAAGNQSSDACLNSPSSSGGSSGPAITVGSIGIGDAISPFSNTGSCVDVYAPGEDILSAWIGSPQTINVLSGTSMACPHVTGLIAYLMVQNASLAASPAAMKSFITATALRGVVSGGAIQGDRHLLANNGIKGQNTGGILGASANVAATPTSTPSNYTAVVVGRDVGYGQQTRKRGFLDLGKLASAAASLFGDGKKAE